MDFSQTIQHAGENAAHKAFGNVALMFLDELLQGAALFVFHDQIHGVVGPEEVQNADHVRVRQAGQGAAFLKKAFHAVTEGADVVGGDDWFGLASAAQSQAVGNVFLDRNLFAVWVRG
ncbi:MAG: hypothetical protein ACD_10C00508G0001, partial [uncultured bacterium]